MKNLSGLFSAKIAKVDFPIPETLLKLVMLCLQFKLYTSSYCKHSVIPVVIFQ